MYQHPTGSRHCAGCGRTISATRRACLACLKAEFEKAQTEVMTFKVTPTQFPLLAKELADSGQVTMTPAPTSSAGMESGTITHAGVDAQYSFDPNTLTLTVNVVEGGGLITNHVIHSKVQNAIDALKA